MSGNSIYANLVRVANGPWSTAYGPFVLQSAFQPIFRQLPNGRLDIDSFEGFVRTERNGDAYPPSQFFSLIEQGDLPAVDSLLRTIHILNAGLMKRSRARLFVSINPALYPSVADLRHEIEHLRLSAHEASMAPERIVCEIAGNAALDAGTLADCADRLRRTGLRIAITNYGADENDVELIKRIRPDYVKFDGHWVRDYMHNSAGFALLKVFVRQFSEGGIQPIFDRLEDLWQVDLCAEIGVPLLQGYALARPETAPTTFDLQFPEMLWPPADALGDVHGQRGDATAAPIGTAAPIDRRPSRVFGKRQS